MSYHLYIFRKEVQENNKDLEFLENEALITPFTNEQFNKLRKRLLKYGYQIESESADFITFNFQNSPSGIKAILTKNQLSFISSFDQEGIFEISQTSSEFTDTGEFKKLDPQDGVWEDL